MVQAYKKILHQCTRILAFGSMHEEKITYLEFKQSVDVINEEFKHVNESILKSKLTRELNQINDLIDNEKLSENDKMTATFDLIKNVRETVQEILDN